MKVEDLIGRRIALPDQFTAPVTVENAERSENVIILSVRTLDGSSQEAFLEIDRLADLLTSAPAIMNTLVDADSFFLYIETNRIKNAFAYDPHFAVSLSRVRPLPHQLEAVYERILPQIRLRFLLADDPGAGKTIMTGLLIKELKLRHIIDRVLILTPAPLTVQWQDELESKFTENFEVIDSSRLKNQLAGNPWERCRQCITSIDFAKREEILPGILQVDWDLVVIDESHKCSARTQGEGLRPTGRYRLAEELSRNTERILLLTATPHQGNVDQFHNFLRLVDPDQFISDRINPKILQLEDSPWFLRRVKEELKDFEGRKLFKERYPITVPFELSKGEESLYKEITKYINRYLGQTQGKRKAAIALARIVFQRRLASSLHAIYSSLQKREKRLSDLLQELDNLSPIEQRQRLQEMGKAIDPEQEDGDWPEEDLDAVILETTIAEQIDEIRDEVSQLHRLVKQTDATIKMGTETKLNELKNCLERAQFNELQDGRGKLLIFTEHRDTLNYLKKNFTDWGFTTCEIHGGMNAMARKAAQTDFQFNKQICLATEAAGEGINLQFCHLMINYDIPWSPHRLEQRMGRIHRIGQPRDVYIFNFVAINTVEGRVLDKLLTKLEEIRKAMGDRVFDVIGQLLQLNEIRLEDLLRDATYDQNHEERATEAIAGLDPALLERLADATGIALATSHVDFSVTTRTRDFISEEQRLMPRYVEEFFRRACHYLGINLETRADGLWRIPYLKEEFRSPNLVATRRLGVAEKNYPKVTFYQEELEKSHHADAEFVSPGHPLFAAIAERLDRQLAETIGYQCALFLDADATEPYRLHFFEVEIDGQNIKGETVIADAKLSVILEKADRSRSLTATDCLHDLSLASSEEMTDSIATPTVAEQQDLEKWLKSQVQFTLLKKAREQREKELNIRLEYLDRAMNAAIADARGHQMSLNARIAKGEEEYRVARDNAANKVRSLTERHQNKRKEMESLRIVRPGRVKYLGTGLVCPPPIESAHVEMRNDPEVEAIAMQYVLEYERKRGWTPEDISQNRDGSGFDIRSTGPADDGTGNLSIRRIEVKGRANSQAAIALTTNEWRRAQQLGDTYWLYVVWGCKTPELELFRIQNPAQILAGSAKEYKPITRYLISAGAIERNACRENDD